jgi:hypothetical protein
MVKKEERKAEAEDMNRMVEAAERGAEAARVAKLEAELARLQAEVARSRVAEHFGPQTESVKLPEGEWERRRGHWVVHDDPN